MTELLSFDTVLGYMDVVIVSARARVIANLTVSQLLHLYISVYRWNFTITSAFDSCVCRPVEMFAFCGLGNAIRVSV